MLNTDEDWNFVNVATRLSFLTNKLGGEARGCERLIVTSPLLADLLNHHRITNN